MQFTVRPRLPILAMMTIRQTMRNVSQNFPTSVACWLAFSSQRSTKCQDIQVHRRRNALIGRRVCSLQQSLHSPDASTPGRDTQRHSRLLRQSCSYAFERIAIFHKKRANFGKSRIKQIYYRYFFRPSLRRLKIVDNYPSIRRDLSVANNADIKVNPLLLGRT